MGLETALVSGWLPDVGSVATVATLDIAVIPQGARGHGW